MGRKGAGQGRQRRRAQVTDTGEAARIGGARVSARTEDARALKPRMELTSGSHNSEDQEWIHGCRSVAGWVVESLYTSQGDGEGGACAGGGCRHSS